jgi:GTP-binding protein
MKAMKIKKAELLKSAGCKKDFPPERFPEVVLAGRSNVGKSSLINTLAARRSLAKTSNTPGKTRSVNFYLIDDSWLLVDLPGYGYARVSRQVQEKWGSLIEDYLAGRKAIIMVIHVVDLRHEPSEQDRQMADWLRRAPFSAVVVATKADKISRGKRAKQREVVARALDLAPGEVLLFSSQTGEGRDDLYRIIEQKLALFSR